MSLSWLDDNSLEFPPLEDALHDPNGLLAVGGDLSIERLLQAYRSGIFPWYSEDQPILWWSPDPRMVLRPDALRISKSLRKQIRRSNWRLTLDTAFPQVISCCAGERGDDAGTWISEEMQDAYIELHRGGHAHSVEVRDQQSESLLGGLYGVAIGKVFFGESMFSNADNASKVALVYLMEQLNRWNYSLVDCQVASEHLLSLGAGEISRKEFVAEITELTQQQSPIGQWSFDDAMEADLKASL